MSADNYTTCPKCFKHEKDKEKKDIEATNEAYGKISREKFLQLVESLNKRYTITRDDSLRENYEFYLSETGYFTVSYYSSCSKCDFEYSFHHTEQLEV